MIQIDFGDAIYINEQDDDEEDNQPRGENFEETKEEKEEGRKGTFVGTALYVSPEMLNDNVAYPASDIWALGCTIYKMLTGEAPF
jgi:3-phosphoinositide dependent protein kinase-1